MFPHERSLVQDMQGRPFVLLGVNNDGDINTVRKSVRKNRINWRSFIDGSGGPIVRQFGIRAFPTIMLIDHHGVIVHANIPGKKLDGEILRLVEEAEAAGLSGKIKPEFRTFRDKTGKHRIVARAESWDGEQVVLRKKEGGTVTLSVSELSRSDQKYLKTVDLEQTVADTPAVDTPSVDTPSVDTPPVDTPPVVDESATDAAGSAYRVFVDSTGKHKISAQFVKLEDDTVTLKKRDGSIVELPVGRLSEKDRQYVRDQKQDSGK